MSKFVKIPVKKEIYSELYLEIPDDCNWEHLQRGHYDSLIKEICVDIGDVFDDDSDWNADISCDGIGEEIQKEEFDKYFSGKIEDDQEYPKIGI